MTGYASLLYKLYGRVSIPAAVWKELTSPDAPAPVRQWVAQKPDWLEVHSGPQANLAGLDPGQAEALALAKVLAADLVLMDERRGRAAAAELHLPVIGTVGILAEAADADMIILDEAIEKLQQTSYRISDQLIEAALRNDRMRRQSTTNG